MKTTNTGGQRRAICAAGGDPLQERCPLRDSGIVTWEEFASGCISFKGRTCPVLDAIPAKLALVDADGKIIAVNRTWVAFNEANHISGGVGDDYLAVCQSFVSSDRELFVEVAAAFHGVISEGMLDTTFRYPMEVGSERRWYRARLAPLSIDRDRRGAIAMHFDVTESFLAEQKLLKFAHYDSLTGLPNRALFIDRLQAAIADAERSHMRLALVSTDLERFKDVNDSFGHAAGDEMLREFGGRLEKCIRRTDTVCRIGGDEFALILRHLNDVGDAALVAHKLADAMRTPFHVAGKEVFGSASIGISVFPDDAADSATLLAHADTAMYRSRQAGHSSFQFYTDAMYTDASKRLQLDNELFLAVEHNEFELYYQPKVCCASGTVVGAEALIRWRHPQRGMVLPAEFIPELEELKLIGSVGAWAIEEVCRQIREWTDDDLEVPCIAVNLSALQLAGDDLVVTVRDVLQKFRVPPASLELELTEGMLMHDVGGVISTLAELKSIGIRLSVDDFGTGYSSLAYLKQFPIDALKVDRSFVRDITTDPNDASITRAIISMGHQLDLKVVAEGVETEGQLALLLASQCDEIQGYLFSPPVPSREFADLLREKRRLPTAMLGSGDAQRSILIVDDDPGVLASLRRLFRHDGYRVLTATSPQEGLEGLARNKVDVIICDQRMSGMTGVELLRRVKSIHPEVIRMVLSGYTELQSVIDAINEGAIYRFLTKPWDDEQLRNSVREALRHKSLADENRLLGANLLRANTKLDDANRQLQELLKQNQDVIERDETALSVTQQLLHQVPIAIIGIDDMGLIVFANKQAMNQLGNGSPLLGASVGAVLPAPLADLLSSPGGSAMPWVSEGGHYRALLRPLNEQQPQQGKVLALIPETEVNHVYRLQH